MRGSYGSKAGRVSIKVHFNQLALFTDDPVDRMSSWCLTASDSATTAPRPPGLASRARVTSKWAIELNSKHIEANFNGLRRNHKSALQQCIPPESAIRYTQV